MSSHSSGSHPLQRPLCLTLAFFFLAIFALVIREASAQASPLWISWICYLTAFALVLRLTIVRDDTSLQTRYLPWHLARGFFGFGASFLYMLALRDTSLIDATLLLNTTSLFLPLLVASWYYPSLLTKMLMAVCSGIVGITILMKPANTMFEEVGDWLGLASGLSLTVAFLCLRRLALVDTTACINIHFFGIATLLQTPFLFLFGALPTAHEIGLAIIAGISMSIAQWLLVTAYKEGEVAQIGLFQYSMVFFVGALDLAMGGAFPPHYSWIATLLLVLATFLASWVIPAASPASVEKITAP